MLRGLLDRLVLLAGTVAGGCVPGFIQQYRQRVGGRLDQVREEQHKGRKVHTRAPKRQAQGEASAADAAPASEGGSDEAGEGAATTAPRKRRRRRKPRSGGGAAGAPESGGASGD